MILASNYCVRRYYLACKCCKVVTLTNVDATKSRQDYESNIKEKRFDVIRTICIFESVIICYNLRANSSVFIPNLKEYV